MIALKTVDTSTFAGAFAFVDAGQDILPVGATRPAFNADGSLRSYYDNTGTKQFTEQGLAEFNAALADAVVLTPGYSYSNDNWDYTAIK